MKTDCQKRSFFNRFLRLLLILCLGAPQSAQALRAGIEGKTKTGLEQELQADSVQESQAGLEAGEQELIEFLSQIKEAMARKTWALPGDVPQLFIDLTREDPKLSEQAVKALNDVVQLVSEELHRPPQTGRRVSFLGQMMNRFLGVKPVVQLRLRQVQAAAARYLMSTHQFVEGSARAFNNDSNALQGDVWDWQWEFVAVRSQAVKGNGHPLRKGQFAPDRDQYSQAFALLLATSSREQIANFEEVAKAIEFISKEYLSWLGEKGTEPPLPDMEQIVGRFRRIIQLIQEKGGVPSRVKAAVLLGHYPAVIDLSIALRRIWVAISRELGYLAFASTLEQKAQEEFADLKKAYPAYLQWNASMSAAGLEVTGPSLMSLLEQETDFVAQELRKHPFPVRVFQGSDRTELYVPQIGGLKPPELTLFTSGFMQQISYDQKAYAAVMEAAATLFGTRDDDDIIFGLSIMPVDTLEGMLQKASDVPSAELVRQLKQKIDAAGLITPNKTVLAALQHLAGPYQDGKPSYGHLADYINGALNNPENPRLSKPIRLPARITPEEVAGIVQELSLWGIKQGRGTVVFEVKATLAGDQEAVFIENVARDLTAAADATRRVFSRIQINYQFDPNYVAQPFGIGTGEIDSLPNVAAIPVFAVEYLSAHEPHLEEKTGPQFSIWWDQRAYTSPLEPVDSNQIWQRNAWLGAYYSQLNWPQADQASASIVGVNRGDLIVNPIGSRRYPTGWESFLIWDEGDVGPETRDPAEVIVRGISQGAEDRAKGFIWGDPSLAIPAVTEGLVAQARHWAENNHLDPHEAERDARVKVQALLQRAHDETFPAFLREPLRLLPLIGSPDPLPDYKGAAEYSVKTALQHAREILGQYLAQSAAPAAGLEEGIKFIHPREVQGFEKAGGSFSNRFGGSQHQQVSTLALLNHLRVDSSTVVFNVAYGDHPLVLPEPWAKPVNLDPDPMVVPPSRSLMAKYLVDDVAGAVQKKHSGKVVLLYRPGIIPFWGDRFFKDTWALVQPGGWLFLIQPIRVTDRNLKDFHAAFLKTIRPESPSQVIAVSPDGTLDSALALVLQKPAAGLETTPVEVGRVTWQPKGLAPRTFQISIEASEERSSVKVWLSEEGRPMGYVESQKEGYAHPFHRIYLESDSDYGNLELMDVFLAAFFHALQQGAVTIYAPFLSPDFNMFVVDPLEAIALKRFGFQIDWAGSLHSRKVSMIVGKPFGPEGQISIYVPDGDARAKFIRYASGVPKWRRWQFVEQEPEVGEAVIIPAVYYLAQDRFVAFREALDAQPLTFRWHAAGLEGVARYEKMVSGEETGVIDRQIQLPPDKAPVRYVGKKGKVLIPWWLLLLFQGGVWENGLPVISSAQFEGEQLRGKSIFAGFWALGDMEDFTYRPPYLGHHYYETDTQIVPLYRHEMFSVDIGPEGIVVEPPAGQEIYVKAIPYPLESVLGRFEDHPGWRSDHPELILSLVLFGRSHPDQVDAILDRFLRLLANPQWMDRAEPSPSTRLDLVRALRWLPLNQNQLRRVLPVLESETIALSSTNLHYTAMAIHDFLSARLESAAGLEGQPMPLAEFAGHYSALMREPANRELRETVEAFQGRDVGVWVVPGTLKPPAAEAVSQKIMILVHAADDQRSEWESAVQGVIEEFPLKNVTFKIMPYPADGAVGEPGVPVVVIQQIGANLAVPSRPIPVISFQTLERARTLTSAMLYSIAINKAIGSVIAVVHFTDGMGKDQFAVFV